MDHIAIMRKSWGLLPKIASGKKTIESRWYKTKHTPWNKIKAGDTLWFKDTGEPVTIRARVTRVLQIENLDDKKTGEILEKYGKSDLGMEKYIPEEIADYFKNKNYCLLVFFNQVERIKPFNIDKTGFGAMAAWISTPDINQIITPL
jgi:ASC-1-like (ASCH) protein